MGLRIRQRGNRQRKPVVRSLPCLLESLETRQLLAADAFVCDRDVEHDVVDFIPPADLSAIARPALEEAAEGESPIPNLSHWFPSGWEDFSNYEWTEVNESASWTPRAGLQVVQLWNRLYLMGGRTPLDPAESPAPGASVIWGDVWTSDDLGRTWRQQLATESEGHWSPRAYFQAVTKGAAMYVMGGQDFQVVENPNPAGPPFLSVSEFFNDVWRSYDGVHWTQLTDDAGWEGRAGLSSVVHNGEIYVMGGSFNDDSAVIGGPPERVYFNDVWKSRDGRTWERLTESAPWAPRAGAQVVTKDGYIYLLGGEDGFTCDSGSRCPPYFNDVWRSRDGAAWELVTDSAAWSPRPGHEAVVANGQIVVFGGFGLSDDPSDPFRPANPTDMWASHDGATWTQLEDSPWNATGPAEGKYDFAALVVRGSLLRPGDTIMTFGGDRETFDFNDPLNYQNVDNDVWRFSPAGRGGGFLRTFWQNLRNRYDVDDDGAVTLRDVLHLVHELRAPRAHAPGIPTHFYDVTGDFRLTLQDVLGVVGRLRAGDPGDGEGEGELGETPASLSWAALPILAENEVGASARARGRPDGFLFS